MLRFPFFETLNVHNLVRLTFYSGGSRISQRRGANHQGGSTNLLFGQNFYENCMKMKEFGPRWGTRVPGAQLDPPMFYENKLVIKLNFI